MPTNLRFPRPPTPETISDARKRYGLIQAEAGALIYYTENGWQRLEYGQRALQPALWEYWLIRAAAAKRAKAAKRKRAQAARKRRSR